MNEWESLTSRHEHKEHLLILMLFQCLSTFLLFFVYIFFIDLLSVVFTDVPASGEHHFTLKCKCLVGMMKTPYSD